MIDHPDELNIEASLEKLSNDLVRLLMKYHFTIVQKANVDKSLPFNVNIPTLSCGKGHFLVWDAVFYWED